MHRIKQARLSRSVSSFDFPGAYGLKPYTDPTDACVFFGCYGHLPNPVDFKAVMHHMGLAVVVWCGSDAMLIPPRFLRQMRRKRNIKHVAIGSFIADDLKRNMIDYVKIPLTPTRPQPDPQPLGRHVYCYLPSANRAQRDFYGGKYLDQVMRMLPKEKFIITRPRQYKEEQMKAIYKKCYIGLRLTKHDGLSNTVMELGAMGRMCLYNDNVPNAIPWRGVGDIISAIKREKQFVGQTKTDIANAIGNFLNVDDSWLHTNFWK